MTTESSTDEWCDWPQCPNEAWYRVSAQWTIFDYDHLYTCLDHLGAAERYFYNRLVDGQRPFGVKTVTLEIHTT